MKKTLLLLAILFPLVACSQTIGGSVSLGGGVTIGSSGTTPPITGGQLLLPSTTVVGARFPYLFVSSNGRAYFAQNGPASNPGTGLWDTPSAAACEATPSTCPWTLVNKAGQPTVNGVIDMLSQAIDIDSTHILMLFGYAGTSGGCTSANDKICLLSMFDAVAKTFTTITLPGQVASQALSFITRDSAGLCYTGALYGGTPLWVSPDATCSGTWTQITTGYASLPGLSGLGLNGNVYIGKVIGSRLYFGGEEGVLSCNLSFSSCSTDYLPKSVCPSGCRNFSTLLADQDAGSATNPVLMLECCKQDNTVSNYIELARYTTGGGWVNLTTSSGLAQFGSSDFYDSYGLAQGTGTARRYYFVLGPTNLSTARSIFVSTTSAGTNYVAYTSAVLPASTSTGKVEQIAQGSSGTVKWVLYCGTGQGSPMSAYVTP